MERYAAFAGVWGNPGRVMAAINLLLIKDFVALNHQK